MTKPYAGILYNWRRVEVPLTTQQEEEYGVKSPGAVYHGTLGRDYRNRGFDNGPVRTSLVLREGRFQIETLNSIYRLSW